MTTMKRFLIVLLLAAAAFAQSAQILTPNPSAPLPGAVVTFTWSSVPANQYVLNIGTAANGSNLYASPILTTTSATVSVPTGGGHIYLTLYSVVNGSWQAAGYNLTTYTPGQSSPAAMTSPTPSSTLPGSSVTFTWSSGTNVTQYWLTAGWLTGPNAGQSFFNNQNVGATSATITNVPTDGQTLYVNLWSMISGQWVSAAYQYTAANGSLIPAVQYDNTVGATVVTPASSADDYSGVDAPAYTAANPMPDDVTNAGAFVSPNYGAGLNQVFSTTFADNTVSGSLILFNSAVLPDHACYGVAFPTGVFNLMNDAGNAWLGAWQAFPLQNSQCRINGITVSSSAAGFTVNWNITFYPGFAGLKNTYIASILPSGSWSPWLTVGTWSVGGGSDNMPAQYLTVQTANHGKVQILRGDNPQMKSFNSSHRSEGDKNVYTYTMDTRDVSMIVLGGDGDRITRHVSSTVPDGWTNGGRAWWPAKEGQKGQESATYEVTSDWIPGPMPMRIRSASAGSFVVPSFAESADNEKIANAAGIYSNSRLEWVIGPALPPNPTKEQVDDMIARRIGEGLLFLQPLAEGKTLQDLTPSTDFEKEVVESLAKVMKQ